MKIWTKVEQPMPAKVVIPYVKKTNKHLLQTVVDALRIQFVQPELHLLKGETSYWELINGLWKEGEEFFIVEHDIIAWPGAINMMKICVEPWCTLPSLCHGKMVTYTFGCVKFGQELIDEMPNIWEDIAATEGDPRIAGKTWFRLDASFANMLGWPDRQSHVHYPAAIHMNEIQWPDEISRREGYKKIAWQHIERYGLEGDEPIVKVNGEVVEPVDQKTFPY